MEALAAMPDDIMSLADDVCNAVEVRRNVGVPEVNTSDEVLIVAGAPALTSVAGILRRIFQQHNHCSVLPITGAYMHGASDSRCTKYSR